MGYYGNGFVLTASPHWERLGACLSGALSLRGYVHRSQPIWLLDAWVPSRREHWPFTERLPRDLFLGSDLPAATAGLLEPLARVYGALEPAEREYCLGYLRAVAQVSEAVAQPAFFFAADDDLMDMAARRRLVSSRPCESGTRRARWNSLVGDFV
jgi:hypothetical protein